jgi:hypothetical protein
VAALPRVPPKADHQKAHRKVALLLRKGAPKAVLPKEHPRAALKVVHLLRKVVQSPPAKAVHLKVVPKVPPRVVLQKAVLKED